MRRLICLVLLAGTAITASAQDTSAKVTYTSSAARIGTELDAIAKLTSVSLAVSQPMESEIVLVDVKDVPLSTVMAKIAAVTSGAWEQVTGGGYRLIPDSSLRRQEGVSSRMQRVKKLDDQIKKLYDPIQKKPQLNADNVGNGSMNGNLSVGLGGGGTGMTMTDESPSGRAVARILKAIGPGPFADLEPGDRVVWATNPNRAQTALPSAANSAIQTLVDEQRVFAAAAAKNKKDDNNPPEQQEAIKQITDMFGLNLDSMSKPLAGPPAKVLFIAARQSIFGNVALSLILFDANGKVIMTGRNNLQVGGGFLDMGDLTDMANQMKQPPKQDNEKEIALSPLSKEMATMRGAGGMNGNTMQAKIPDDLRKALLKPDERDPLSFAESEATVALAASKGKGLVAELPDSMLQFSIAGFVGGQKLTLSSFADKLRKVAAVEEQDGVLVVKPTDPFGNRLARVDRKALALFIQASNGKEFAPLEELAKYALRNPEPSETPAATTYFMIFAPDALQSGIGGRADWNMLRLFATLPEQTRLGMERGSAMPLGNLTPDQAGYAARLLFGANVHLQVENPNAAKSAMPGFFEQAMSMFKMPTDYRAEPTEAMPNGLPRAGTLSLDVSNEPVMKSTSQGMMGMAALGLDELAMLQFFKETPQFAQAQAYMPNLDQLKLGSRNIYHFKFRVAPDISESETLIDNTMSADAQMVSMSNLPDAIKKQIDARIAQFKKLPFFNPAFFGGGGAIPPR